MNYARIDLRFEVILDGRKMRDLPDVASFYRCFCLPRIYLFLKVVYQLLVSSVHLALGKSGPF